MPSYTYGGQALIEGVLMRGRDAIAVAFRHPDGEIVYATERLDSGFHGTRWSKLPFIRGLVVLYETLVVGTRWLVRSANVQAEEDGRRARQGLGRADARPDPRRRASGSSSCCPCSSPRSPPRTSTTASSSTSSKGWSGSRSSSATCSLIGRSPDVSRVFQYHGAEHMTIHALEAGDPLTVDEVRKYPTAHQRCGTEFLVIVILLSIIAFSLVGRQPPLIMIASRILLIPVIAAVGYELLRLGARHRGNPIVKVLLYPGLLVQMITTKQPTDDMIEVAIVSMEQALVADGEPCRPARMPSPCVRCAWRPGLRGRRRRDGSGDPDDPAGLAADPAADHGFARSERPAARDMSDLDAKLAEIARQYDELQAELAQARDLDRSGRHPPAGPGAGAARAGRRGVPAPRGDPGRAGRRPRDARFGRRRRRAQGRWPATRSPGSSPTRRG